MPFSTCVQLLARLLGWLESCYFHWTQLSQASLTCLCCRSDTPQIGTAARKCPTLSSSSSFKPWPKYCTSLDVGISSGCFGQPRLLVRFKRDSPPQWLWSESPSGTTQIRADSNGKSFRKSVRIHIEYSFCSKVVVWLVPTLRKTLLSERGTNPCNAVMVRARIPWGHSRFPLRGP